MTLPLSSQKTIFRVSDVSAEIARIAHQEIAMRFLRPDCHATREKTPGDPVTLADTATEAAISRLIETLEPGATIVGEESTETTTDKTIPSIVSARTCWVVDPLDGTRLFTAGKTGFGPLVARIREGVIEHGWMYDPIRRMAAFNSADGAWLVADTKKRLLHLDRQANRRRCIILDAYMPDVRSHRIRTVAATAGQTVIENEESGIAAVFALLEGHVNFVVCARMKPWDYAAPAAVVEAAGGFAAPLDGKPWLAHVHGQCALFASSPEVGRFVQRCAGASDPLNPDRMRVRLSS